MLWTDASTLCVEDACQPDRNVIALNRGCSVASCPRSETHLNRWLCWYIASCKEHSEGLRSAPMHTRMGSLADQWFNRPHESKDSYDQTVKCFRSHPLFRDYLPVSISVCDPSRPYRRQGQVEVLENLRWEATTETNRGCPFST